MKADTGRFVEGGGGVDLYAREWGNPDGPEILLIHGWSQSHASWVTVYDSPLADRFRFVAFDLRGHGFSSRPNAPAAYQDGDRMADDVQAVIDAFGLAKPVLVGWSYGGIIVGDYLAKFRDDAIAGIVTVGAFFRNGPGAAEQIFGPTVAAVGRTTFSLDFATQIDGIRRFIEGAMVAPLSPDQLAEAVALNLMTPPQVRAALLLRMVDHGAAFAATTKPLLVIHGTEDQVVRVGVSEAFRSARADAEVIVYDGIGHVPFFEAAEHFNDDLAQFVGRIG